ncbi:hypothetical protein Focb16_v002213 [Fusarium oxysporum f. sp. cubense]|uniref:Uncharacterized protein n=1 Tax=Fusarium oxysporum f. sp. cubense TaxID=61366 RepID=A0A559L5E5_FUSOC|nr:hypothetical protein Focb16_v002213 [Fusarium oxysporum f. sp. cubense]
MGDGILVYDAFCSKIHPLHLRTMSSCFASPRPKKKIGTIQRRTSSQFWNDLKAGKEKIKNQHKYNQQISFADAPSPYNDKPMLFEFASIMFKNLVKLL